METNGVPDRSDRVLGDRSLALSKQLASAKHSRQKLIDENRSTPEDLNNIKVWDDTIDYILTEIMATL